MCVCGVCVCVIVSMPQPSKRHSLLQIGVFWWFLCRFEHEVCVLVYVIVRD